MPAITHQDLIDAAVDTDTLEAVVNGAPDRPNPGQPNGTVTTRLGRVIRTVANVLATLDIDVDEETFAAEVAARIAGDDNLYNMVNSLAGSMITVELFADIATTDVPSTVEVIRTTGYSVVGIGAAMYLRTGSTGEASFRTQSNDGDWWILAEHSPDLYQLGAQADATTGSPIDYSALLNVLCGTDVDKHNIRLGDNYILDTSTGGFRIGGATVLVRYDQSLIGDGWATKLIVGPSPAVTTMFGLNTDGAGSWNSPRKPFPGELNSKVGEFYIDGRAASGTLTAFEFGGSYHFHDIHAGGFHTLLKQINQYCDLITVSRITIFDQPGNGEYAIDLKWAGDGCDVSQLHSFRKAPASPIDALATKSLRVRYKVGSSIRNSINGDHMVEGCDSIDVSAMHMEDGAITFQESTGTLRNATFWMRDDALGAMSIVPLHADYGTYSSLHPTVVHWTDIGFVYQQNFPSGFHYTTKHNFNLKDDPYPFLGIVTIDRMFRRSKPQGGLASMGTKIGVSCGMEDFDNYSHWASMHSEYRNSRWCINADAGDLPFTDAILDSANSVASTDYIFQGTTATYYYRAQGYFDKLRKIGLSSDGAGAISIAGTNGGTSPTLVLTEVARQNWMLRIYRGTTAGVYDSYVDIPLCAGARLVDVGPDICGYPWISRTPGVMDVMNTGGIGRFTLRPGSSDFTSSSVDAYGHCEVHLRSNGVIPTVGEWRAGDKVTLLNPVTDGFDAFHGWIRKTTGSAHVLGTDWMEVFTNIKAPFASSDKFTTITEPVNTTFKWRGRTFLDTTTGKLIYASNTTAGAVWNYYDGTLAYTPA